MQTEFSASLLQSSVSHDPSEICWFASQETFLIINVENIFVEYVIHFFLKILWEAERLQEQHLLKMLNIL